MQREADYLHWERGASACWAGKERPAWCSFGTTDLKNNNDRVEGLLNQSSAVVSIIDPDPIGYSFEGLSSIGYALSNTTA
jgi:hypothetical protein